MVIDTEREQVVHVLSHELTKFDAPKRYYIVMHNDDTTPLDFVIELLVGLYRHDEQTAVDLANKIHVDEKAIVGMYNMEIAEQKIDETVQVSRANNHSLTVTMEAAD